MIAGPHRPHAGTGLLDHTGAFVTAEHREVLRDGRPGGFHERHHVRSGHHVAGDEVVVGVAQAGNRHLHQDLALTGRVERDLLDLPVPADTPQHRPLALHRSPSRGLRPTRRRPRPTAARMTAVNSRVLRREYGYQLISLD